MYLREPQYAILEYNILNLIVGMYCYFDGKFSILPSLNVAIHGLFCIALGPCKSLEKVYEGMLALCCYENFPTSYLFILRMLSRKLHTNHPIYINVTHGVLLGP